ncbi:MAG: phage tail assembly chaperone [Caulobacterales bacterium]|nr:phage tail assembly chaperone [Caulobacterales bacterium]
MKIPFAKMQKHALQNGISPIDFWQLSLVEWRNCFGNEANFLGHKDLEELIKKIESNSNNARK